MRVSFTGHRPEKICGWVEAPLSVEISLRKALAREIVRLTEEEGAEVFVSGMAPGVDLWAADEVLRLRSEGRIVSSTRLELAIPYPSFERSFDAAWHPLYHDILAKADAVHYVCHGYHKGCYTLRNDFLVENADLMLAYYEGSEGGTRYTLRRAAKCGLRTINLHQPQLFDFPANAEVAE